MKKSTIILISVTFLLNLVMFILTLTIDKLNWIPFFILLGGSIITWLIIVIIYLVKRGTSKSDEVPEEEKLSIDECRECAESIMKWIFYDDIIDTIETGIENRGEKNKPQTSLWGITCYGKYEEDIIYKIFINRDQGGYLKQIGSREWLFPNDPHYYKEKEENLEKEEKVKDNMAKTPIIRPPKIKIRKGIDEVGQPYLITETEESTKKEEESEMEDIKQ